MPLVQAQCTHCDALLYADSKQEAAKCPICKAPYVVADAVLKFKDHEYTPAIPSGFEFAEMLLTINEWQEAKEQYTQLTESYPDDICSWTGLLSAITMNRNATLVDINTYRHITQLVQKVKDMGCNDAETWDEYMKTLDQGLKEKQAELKDEYEAATRKYRSHARKNHRIGLLGTVGIVVFIAGIVMAVIAAVHIAKAPILFDARQVLSSDKHLLEAGILVALLGTAPVIIEINRYFHRSNQTATDDRLTKLTKECRKYGVKVPDEY